MCFAGTIDWIAQYTLSPLEDKLPLLPIADTVATELMQKPEQNLYVRQKLLGHRDIKVKLSYIEHNVEMLRSCVERG